MDVRHPEAATQSTTHNRNISVQKKIRESRSSIAADKYTAVFPCRRYYPPLGDTGLIKPSDVGEERSAATTLSPAALGDILLSCSFGRLVPQRAPTFTGGVGKKSEIFAGRPPAAIRKAWHGKMGDKLLLLLLRGTARFDALSLRRTAYVAQRQSTRWCWQYSRS